MKSHKKLKKFTEMKMRSKLDGIRNAVHSITKKNLKRIFLFLIIWRKLSMLRRRKEVGEASSKLEAN